MLKNKTVTTWMLEEAEFVIASEHSIFDVWVLSDGASYGLIADDVLLFSDWESKGSVRLREWIFKEWFPKEFDEDPENKSEFKIGRGIGFPTYFLKDAEITMAKTKGIYCYITDPDGVKHMFTRHQIFRLSNRGGKHVDRLRAFLKHQGGWPELLMEGDGKTYQFPESDEVRKIKEEMLQNKPTNPVTLSKQLQEIARLVQEERKNEQEGNGRTNS